MNFLEEQINKLENSEIFVNETDWDLDYENSSTYLRFNRQKAKTFINEIIFKIKRNNFKLSFKETLRGELNRATIEEKKWLLDKLKKQIEYQEEKYN